MVLIKGIVMKLFFKLMLLVTCASAYATQWKRPDLNTPYNQICFLTSHNSFSSIAYGYFPYAQQSWTITDQLKNGVRALMLDTYEYKGLLNTVTNAVGLSLGSKPQVVLCHGNCDLSSTLLRPARAGVQTLDSALKEVETFLKNSTTEVVTIILENYVTDEEFLNNAFNRVKKYILTPQDLYSLHNEWPTLTWMTNNNKRLVIFSDTTETSRLFFKWDHIAESQYGTVDPKEAAKERERSQNYQFADRSFYLLNFFPHFPLPTTLESWVSIRKLLEHLWKNNNFSEINGKGVRACVQESITNTFPGRYPNFIALDYVNFGDPVALVNEINDMARDPQARANMFRTIEHD